MLTRFKAAQALRLLSNAERDRARKFHFLRDGKLSVGSALLKRLYVHRATGEDWKTTQFAREGDTKHGKPCHKPVDGKSPIIDFNVTHQAGLVGLVGCAAAHARLGVDVVCVDERRGLQIIKREGLEKFIDMHDEVFSEADMQRMRAADADEAERLRRFFAYWALKEAYIKMVGEGLLAKWLKHVEFRNVTCPSTATQALDPFGGTVRDIEIWRNGKKVVGVDLILQAFESNYMIATAIERKRPHLTLTPTFVMLDPERDIYAVAEA